MSWTLALIPLLLGGGFLLLGVAPLLGVLIAVQVVRRAGNYAIMKPSREMLFVVLDRGGKIQGEERDRHDHLSQRRCAQRLGLYRAAGPRSRPFGHRLHRPPLSGLWAWICYQLGKGRKHEPNQGRCRHERKHGIGCPEGPSSAPWPPPCCRVGRFAGAVGGEKDLIRKAIPATGETLPVIGLGTSLTLDVDDDETALAGLAEVLREFFDNGGELIDSSPMYGSAEQVIGVPFEAGRSPRKSSSLPPRSGPTAGRPASGRWRIRFASGASAAST